MGATLMQRNAQMHQQRAIYHVVEKIGVQRINHTVEKKCSNTGGPPPSMGRLLCIRDHELEIGVPVFAFLQQGLVVEQ